MFTGIIQDIGTIVQIEQSDDQQHFTFETALDGTHWQLGDSIAVDGCCLTITAFPKAQQWRATLSQETLKLTHFSQATCGQSVNMEPALRVGDALGGHIVSGHIDGLAKLTDIQAIGEHRQMTFEVPPALAAYIVSKGSVTLNGTSLTVNQVDDCCFTVNLIPHTLQHTNLGALAIGDAVNLETDMLGRYVERLLSMNPQMYLGHTKESL